MVEFLVCERMQTRAQPFFVEHIIMSSGDNETLEHLVGIESDLPGMEKDGFLIIGATESLINVDPRYEPRRYLRSVFYQLK